MPATAPRRADAPAARSAPVSPRGGTPVTARGLSKSFGANPVIRGLDLHVPAGQFVAIVGRSGCGKSTLLRLLLGLEKASAGEVQAGAPKAARLMFQEPRLLPWARVAENVEVGLDAATPAAERTARALETLREVGLADRAGEWPSVLSGGQKQRVALARALASRPRLLALDEPLGALDALTRIEMQGLIERAWRAQGFTALLVTHDVAEAVALADRVLVVEDGGISLDLPVTLPRPRRRGDPAMAALEGQILDRLFNDHGTGI